MERLWLHRAICGPVAVAAAGHNLHIHPEQTAIGIQQRLLRRHQPVAHSDLFQANLADRSRLFPSDPADISRLFQANLADRSRPGLIGSLRHR